MVKRWITLLLMIAFTPLCLNSISYASEGCTENCHKDIVNTGEHKGVSCVACHVKNEKHFLKVIDFDTCLICHETYKDIKKSVMHTKSKEKEFVHKTFDKVDKNFYDKNCNNCHVSSCSDCHKVDGKSHSILIPTTDTCLKCHNSYFIGHEYKGLGIRDDHERYQRGVQFDNKSYLKMLPDIHFEKGLSCKECHDMLSIAQGKKSSKSCVSCHKKIDKNIVEHKIDKHITDMECYTCHSSWVPMEFGTFWIKFEDSSYKQYFRWLRHRNDEYVKSSFYVVNDRVIIGKNEVGKYTPIRPQFITFFTSIKDNLVLGEENQFLSGNFKTVFPHTIRGETVNCEYCHDNEKTYMLEKDEDRIFLPEKDGLNIKNFFNSKEFEISNGKFLTKDELIRIMRKDDYYYKNYISKNREIFNFIKGIK